MKAIIIEDEPLVARDLQKLIAVVAPTIKIEQILSSVKQSLQYFSTEPEPDLIFMDIQLSDGVSFDILKKIKITCPVIFTTAYDEYALRAFKVNSIDYLLKPIDGKELMIAIEKLNKFYRHYTDVADANVQSLLKNLSQPVSGHIYKDRFSVHSGKSYMIINADAISYFKVETLIYIVTKDKQQYITDFQTLEEVEELVNPRFFFRANRQYILSAESVESYRTDSYGKLVVQLKKPVSQTVDVSREKAKGFKNWLG